MKKSPDIFSVISKWKINHKMLATSIGMPKGTFNNKLNPNHTSQFTEQETSCIKKVLSSMGAEIVEISK